ncbi:MAG: transposase [Candidatus Peribacteraceae bacterium]
MSQKHYVQQGVFHITTNTKNKVPWLTLDSIPALLIDNLVMSRNIHGAKVFAFCILPDHMHIILEPGQSGLSALMHSFKRNVMRDTRKLLPEAEVRNFRVSPEENLECCGRYGSSASVNDVPMIRWQKSFHDERIRDSRQRSTVIGYVQYNAVHHRLVKDITDWPWTSLHCPDVLDPMEVWIT